MTARKCFHSSHVLVDTRSRVRLRSICGISRLFYMKADLGFWGRFLSSRLPEEYRDRFFWER